MVFDNFLTTLQRYVKLARKPNVLYINLDMSQRGSALCELVVLAMDIPVNTHITTQGGKVSIEQQILIFVTLENYNGLSMFCFS